MDRRTFLEALSTICLYLNSRGVSLAAAIQNNYSPGRIDNEYSLFLPGEREALAAPITISDVQPGKLSAKINSAVKQLSVGQELAGWTLKAITSMNGSATAVFEKRVTHQGAIVYVTESEGVLLRIPKSVGELAHIRPRQLTSDGVHFANPPYVAGPDLPGNYVLNSNEDPCYENVAGLGAEYIGYTLVGNEEAGPLRSLFLEPDGRSRQLATEPTGQSAWAPDLVGALFNPSHFFPGEDPRVCDYVSGYSKRTLLGGYLPAANVGVWNPQTGAGYEVMVLLPSGVDAQPIGCIRILPPHAEPMIERYWNTTPDTFFRTLAGIANYWQHFFTDHMDVSIPDEWLLNAARAGIVLSRCSYRGLEPTYQIGEGAYTKIPERSHALFPVSFYEFIWAHQLWNLTTQSDPYFQNYLDKYVLPDGNFLYNTQDQAEAPLCIGVYLWNSARAYDYTHDLPALMKRLPVLRRTIGYLLDRYEYSKRTFPPDNPRHGLIWGSPEADLGDPHNDFPNSHPYYFQNAAWAWRGLKQHALCLESAAAHGADPALVAEAKQLQTIVTEMRTLVEQSIQRTIAACDPAMRQAGITPFTPDDLHHDPKRLSSYENHRFMMDWFLADWGDPALDLGHLKHRVLAGEQLVGLGTDGDVSRVSNFMEHGTLSVKIRQDDYRPFLLSLYALCCFAADSGNRYAPEDAYLPGGHPPQGNPYFWSAVVNSVLQPSLGLRWLLCYEESDQDICHLQKAAPKHWFSKGQSIRVTNCPTRWGTITWITAAKTNGGWTVSCQTAQTFNAQLVIHIHTPDGRPLIHTSAGVIAGDRVILSRELMMESQNRTIEVD